MTPKRILIVDDEDLIRDQLCALLEKYGYSCRPASSASVAMNLIQEENFDLATVDVIMPGESGGSP